MPRETVKIFRSYRDAAAAVAASDPADPGRGIESAYRFLMAILDYGLDGTEPELSGAAAAMWMLTKPSLDASIKKADAGAKGGSTPTADKQASSKTEANAKQNESKPEANGKQTSSKTEAEEGSRKKEVGSRIEEESIPPVSPPLGARFDEFWAAYPRKVGKQAAWKAWSKLKPSAELTKAILAAVEYQRNCPQWQKDGGQYIPNPATWLNQGRWEDRLPTPVDQPQRQTGRPTKADELNDFYAMAAKWAGGGETP